MKNIAQGLSLKKYKGNKHKDGGIMVNALGNKTKDVNKAVAEVEGGEYNFRYNPNNPKDNYILSEQLGIAAMAEQADRFKGNNRIDYNTRTNLLNKSMKLNEMLRVQQEQQPMQIAAFGGKLKKYEDGGNPNKTRTPKSFRHIGEFGDSLSEEQYKLIKGDPEQFNKDMMNWSKKSTTPVITPTTTPVTTRMQPFAPLVRPSNADTTKIDVSKEMQQAQVAGDNPVKQKKNDFKGALSAVSGAVSALGPIGQGVGAALQLAPYAIDLGKAMFDKTSVQDLQTQGSAMRLPNTTYAKHGGKLNVVPLPKFDDGGKPRIQKIGDYSFDSNLLHLASKEFQSQANPQGDYTNNKVFITPDNKMVIRNQNNGTYTFFNQPSSPIQKKSNIGTTTTGKNVQPTVNSLSASDIRIREAFKKGTNTLSLPLPTTIKSNTTGITNFATLDVKKEMDIAKRAGFNPLDIVEQPKQKDKLSEMLKSGLMLKGSAMAGSLFSALQPAQKETLRLPDFGRADDAMSRATAFSMNPALNEVEQARGKSQEAIRNMATTAGQLTSNLQSVNQRAGQQSAGLKVQEQQIMNQLAGQKAGYETQKASAIQQELARFDENTLMNKAATQDARVAFVENINNLGTEIMKQGNEQDIADQQDKLAVQNAKLKIIQSAFENPDIISGANLEKMLKMIEKGDYTNMPKLFGQPSDTRRILKAEAAKK